MEGEATAHPISPRAKSITLRFTLPEGYKFLLDAPHTISVMSTDPDVIHVPTFIIPDASFDYTVPIEVMGEGSATINVFGTLFFCPVSDESICMFDGCDLAVPVVISEEGDGTLEIVHEIVPAGL